MAIGKIVDVWRVWEDPKNIQDDVIGEWGEMREAAHPLWPGPKRPAAER